VNLGEAAKLEIVPVETPRDLDAFIRVQHELHRGQPHFIPPLYLERRDSLSPKKNPYFKHAEVRFWYARRGGKPVGRISAQICRIHTNKHDPQGGHFGLIESVDDPEVLIALTSTAEAWLKSKGMRRVLGPFNLSINEQMGLLVDGFETPPRLLMGHDLPHMDRLLEQAGYSKAKDVYAYNYDIRTDPPRAIARLMTRQVPPRLVIRTMRVKEYDVDLARALDIFNDAWADNWGAIPYTPEEVLHLGKELKPLIDPRYFWFAELDGEPVGFIIGLPDLNEAIRDLDGRLLPFGLFKLIWRLKVKGVHGARVPLMGIKRKLQSTAIGAAIPLYLIGKLREAGLARGFRWIELSWILEENTAMRHICEALCGPPYKTYRIYGKELA
jgi:hypothetical protein